MKLSPQESEELSRKLDDGEALARAMRKGVRRALRLHAAANNEVAVWRENRVVLIPASEALEAAYAFEDDGDRSIRPGEIM